MAEGGQEWREGNEDTVGIKALSVLNLFFLLALSIAFMQNWKGEGILLFFIFSFPLSAQISFKLLLSSFSSTESRLSLRKAGQPALFPLCLHPASFFTPRLAQQVRVRTPPPESSRWHMVAQAQMSGYVPGPLDDRQLAPSLFPPL